MGSQSWTVNELLTENVKFELRTERQESSINEAY